MKNITAKSIAAELAKKPAERDKGLFDKLASIFGKQADGIGLAGDEKKTLGAFDRFLSHLRVSQKSDAEPVIHAAPQFAFASIDEGVALFQKRCKQKGIKLDKLIKEIEREKPSDTAYVPPKGKSPKKPSPQQVAHVLALVANEQKRKKK